MAAVDTARVEAATQVFSENIQADTGPSWLNSADGSLFMSKKEDEGSTSTSVWRIHCHLLHILIYLLKYCNNILGKNLL